MAAKTRARKTARKPVAKAKPKALPEAPADRPTVVCQAPDCDVEFAPKRSTAKYHGATCQKRAARARKTAEAAADIDRAAETEDNAGTADAEHGLVKATRDELEKANALNTVDGQIALQLARRLTNPEQSGFDRLAQTLREILRDAIGAPAPTPADDGGPEPEDDEVTRARKAREDARQAAGHP